MNNDQHPLLGALGLCRKAGKLLHGYDRVQENALRGKVALVLLTSDASERTVSHMKDACDGIVACEQMPLTSADHAIGPRTGYGDMASTLYRLIVHQISFPESLLDCCGVRAPVA